MLTKARKGDRYNGQIHLTRDTPVFGVDYSSAYAYAKWRKRRLPSKSEWIRAATGNDNRIYPWGNNPSAPNINLGINRAKNTDPNTYFHVLPSESVPADTGPFQHRDLGGNLSEWIASPDPSIPLYIGGNYLDEAPVDNQNPVRSAPHPTGYPSIGFRTAK
jgi:formylglycine-generating enzyme required for sulfatase activity